MNTSEQQPQARSIMEQMMDQEDGLLERLTELAEQRRRLEDQLAHDTIIIKILAERNLALDSSQYRTLSARLYRFVRQLLGRANPPPRSETPIVHFLDTPQIDDSLFGSLEIYGWAISCYGAIERVEVWLDATLLGLVAYGLPRDDAAAFLGNPALRSCGYSGRFVVPPELDPAQPHTVSVCVIDTLGHRQQIDRPMLLRGERYRRWVEAQQRNDLPTPADDPNPPHYRLVAYIGAAEQGAVARFVACVMAQSYRHWTLELVAPHTVANALGGFDLSDPRIRVRSGTIGDLERPSQPNSYLMLLDLGVLLAADALRSFTAAMMHVVVPDVIYCDHDRLMPDGERAEPCFKPDWSIEYFRQSAYANPLVCIREQIVANVQRAESYESVDALIYDLLLHVAEQTIAISHIPEILGHVVGERSEGERSRNQRIASLGAHLERMAIAGAQIQAAGGSYLRMRPAPNSERPLVSIIIPTRNAPHLIKRCLQTIYAKTTYHPFEVVLVDNETDDPFALEIMQRYPVVRVQLPNPFNYSRANNLGVSHAQGQYLLFLNNDTEVVSPDWIEQLVYYASQADVGAVGALLLYPNQTVQHVGVVLGMNAMADHVLRGFPVSEPVLDDALICVRERSAVTAACLMIKRSDYVQIGGFDQRFNTYFQDVDLCLRLRAIGKRNLVVPQAVLIHHESVTRKFEPDFGDGALMSERWGAVLNAPDPYFHPSYDRHALNLALLLAK